MKEYLKEITGGANEGAKRYIYEFPNEVLVTITEFVVNEFNSNNGLFDVLIVDKNNKGENIEKTDLDFYQVAKLLEFAKSL